MSKDPLQIPWRGIYSRRGPVGQEGPQAKFGFLLPFREGEFLKSRLLRREKITVRAQVEAKMEDYEYQNVICHIPGTDPNAGEVILSAHLYEGIVKQGANDNKSGSAGILEVARTLHTLIEDGRLPRPKRTIRFLWGPEFSGTVRCVQANTEIMEKTLCNIMGMRTTSMMSWRIISGISGKETWTGFKTGANSIGSLRHLDRKSRFITRSRHITVHLTMRCSMTGVLAFRASC
jgi:hypothetical protein